MTEEVSEDLTKRMQDFEEASAAKRPKKLEIEHMCEGALPLDRAGTHLLPKLPSKPLCDSFLEEKKVTEEVLRDHLQGMFIKLLESLSSKDYAAVEKLTEKRLFAKLQEQKSTLSKYKLSFDLNKLEGDDSYIVEQLFVKGVSHDRDLNDSNIDYAYFKKFENQGVRVYTHKYYLGFLPLYLQEHNEQAMQQIEREQQQEDITKEQIAKLHDRMKDIFYSQRKKMLEKSQSIVFRVTLQFTGQNKALSSEGG